MKNPLPRPVPVSIDATAGSAALTTSSIDPEPGDETPASPTGALDTLVGAMLPVTGATNASGACESGGPDKVRPPGVSCCETATATGDAAGWVFCERRT